MKRNAVLAAMLLLTALAASACAPKAPGGQGSKGSNIGGSDTSMKDQGANAPEFLNDLGKTLQELKKEHPEGEFAMNLNGQPDSASACFGEPGAEYAYFFFGGQSGDFEKAMTEGRTGSNAPVLSPRLAYFSRQCRMICPSGTSLR